MYTEHIKTLYLNKSKLRFFDEHTEDALPYELELGQIGTIHTGDKVTGGTPIEFQPDYHLDGSLSSTKRNFKVGGRVKHRMYVTGMLLSESLDNYRLMENIQFSSYWEDRKNNIGILFQVVKHG